MRKKKKEKTEVPEKEKKDHATDGKKGSTLRRSMCGKKKRKKRSGNAKEENQLAGSRPRKSPFAPKRTGTKKKRDCPPVKKGKGKKGN